MIRISKQRTMYPLFSKGLKFQLFTRLSGILLLADHMYVGESVKALAASWLTLALAYDPACSQGQYSPGTYTFYTLGIHVAHVGPAGIKPSCLPKMNSFQSGKRMAHSRLTLLGETPGSGALVSLRYPLALGQGKGSTSVLATQA